MWVSGPGLTEGSMSIDGVEMPPLLLLLPLLQWAISCMSSLKVDLVPADACTIAASATSLALAAACTAVFRSPYEHEGLNANLPLLNRPYTYVGPAVRSSSRPYSLAAPSKNCPSYLRSHCKGG